MINLVVGQPGTGKTQFLVFKILELLAENEKLVAEGNQPRQIYADIKGLMIPEVELSPDDWRDAPDGSIIIYDEVQYRKAYEYKGNQYSQDPMIKDLTIHRHTNKDLWLITQDSARIEKGIHKLVDKMYYLKRPASKSNYTNVFEFDKWLSNPDAAANRNAKQKKYLDFYRFKFSDKYQKLYTSASDHSSIKFRLPRQLYAFGAIILVILSFAALALMNTETFNTKRFEEDHQEKYGIKQDQDKDVSVVDSTVKIASEELSNECRKAINLDRQECKQWFDELSNTNASVNETGQVTISYNPNNPFDENLQKQIVYEVVNKPVFSGCMKYGNDYTAYTQQGTKLKVSKQDCVRLIEENDRPFDYFTEKSNQQNFDLIDEQSKAQEQKEQKQDIEFLSKLHQAKDDRIL